MVDEDRFALQPQQGDLLACIGQIRPPLAFDLHQAHAFPGQGFLEQAAQPLIQQTLTGELDIALARDHRPGFRPDQAIDAGFEHVRAFQLESVGGEIFLLGRGQEFLQSLDGHDGLTAKGRSGNCPRSPPSAP
jgi:hypothetical protein